MPEGQFKRMSKDECDFIDDSHMDLANENLQQECEMILQQEKTTDSPLHQARVPGVVPSVQARLR